MIERIRRAAQAAGVEALPEDPLAPLFEGGVDSLAVVLLVAELERALQVRIPAEQVTDARFASLTALAAWLRELGAS